MSTADSIRTNGLRALKANLEAMAPMAPPPANPLDDWPFKWSYVEMGPLSDPDFRKAFIAGVVAGRETKTDKYPIKECTLEVAIEFQATSNRGDMGGAELAEMVMTAVQRCIHADTTLGGTVVDVQEVGNEVDLETYGDKSVVGVVFLEMKYRHRHTDPRVI